MKTLTVIVAITMSIAIGLSAAYADPKDVNVVNTPDVNIVNDDTNPIPVTIQNGGSTGNVSTVYRFS